jgi:hypothetical protein
MPWPSKPAHVDLNYLKFVFNANGGGGSGLKKREVILPPGKILGGG